MRAVDGYPVIKHRTFRGPGAPTAAARRRGDPAPVGQGAGRPARPGQRVPAGVGRQHLRHELRRAVQERDRGAQPGRRRWPAACRTPARARLAVPPQRRRPGLPDRDVLLRLPRRGRPLRPGQAQGPGRLARRSGRSRSSCRRAPSRASGGMLPGAKVSDEIAEIRGIEAGVDCASPSRHTAFSTSTRCSTSSSCSPTRPGSRSASSRRRQPGVLGPPRRS